jgi:hypothetical protein
VDLVGLPEDGPAAANLIETYRVLGFLDVAAADIKSGAAGAAVED